MDLFEAIANHPADKPALYDTDTCIHYGEFPCLILERSETLAPYRCVAILMDNCAEWVLWDLAAMAAGTALVPLPPFFTGEQRDHALRASGCEALITRDEITELPHGGISLPAGTAKVTYTSGTTGTPKGVCLSKNAMTAVAQSLVDVLGADLAKNHVSVLPLGILLENVAGVYATLLAGGSVFLPSLHSFGENYSSLRDILLKARATSLILVPEILRILMAQIAGGGPLPDLDYIAVGGSKISTHLLDSAREMGLPVYEGYGLSECSSVIALNTPEHNRHGSAGKILPHIKARVEDGEILIENSGFLGYIGEPAPDVIHTGDLGEIDRDGFVFITGRKKHILITSYGRNISPEWVEAELLAQPEIIQAVVFGDAQPSLSALIAPIHPQSDIETAIKRANENLPDYAQIKHFQTIPPLSMSNGTLTGTGRPRRSKIFELYPKGGSHDVL